MDDEEEEVVEELGEVLDETEREMKPHKVPRKLKRHLTTAVAATRGRVRIIVKQPTIKPKGGN